MTRSLDGKVALVTGAASGIGRAAAVVFAREGAKVIAVDIDEGGGRRTVEMIRGSSRDAVFVRGDVSRPEDCAAMVRVAVERFGQLDCAFNNAGIEGTTAPLAECTDEAWQRTLAVNLSGTFYAMKAELQQMLAQGRGAIVNMSSIAGQIGFAGAGAYVAAKHGVIGLTRTAALDYAKKDIRVNAVCPGVIHTPMIDRATRKDAASERQFASMAPMGRMGRPEEIAEAAAWLCSDAASYVTGLAMTIDGGYVAA